MNSRDRATPVGDIAGVECGIPGSHTSQCQLVWKERDVGGGGGGGEGVHVGEGGGREDWVYFPLVESHCWVGLVGAVESDIRTNWSLDVGFINAYTVDNWLSCSEE